MGFVEDIHDELSALFVIFSSSPANRLFVYRQRPVDPRMISRELGVRLCCRGQRARQRQNACG